MAVRGGTEEGWWLQRETGEHEGLPEGLLKPGAFRLLCEAVGSEEKLGRQKEPGRTLLVQKTWLGQVGHWRETWPWQRMSLY